MGNSSSKRRKKRTEKLQQLEELNTNGSLDPYSYRRMVSELLFLLTKQPYDRCNIKEIYTSLRFIFSETFFCWGHDEVGHDSRKEIIVRTICELNLCLSDETREDDLSKILRVLLFEFSRKIIIFKITFTQITEKLLSDKDKFCEVLVEFGVSSDLLKQIWDQIKNRN